MAMNPMVQSAKFITLKFIRLKQREVMDAVLFTSGVWMNMPSIFKVMTPLQLEDISWICLA